MFGRYHLMKKIIALVLVMMLAVIGLSACSTKTTNTVEATEEPAAATEEPAAATEEPAAATEDPAAAGEPTAATQG